MVDKSEWEWCNDQCAAMRCRYADGTVVTAEIWHSALHIEWTGTKDCVRIPTGVIRALYDRAERHSEDVV